VYDIKVDIGADEYSCEKTWHEIDWTYDGVINYEEFSIFSAAWLSHDPNDPSLPSDPNLIDPNDFIGWNPMCNLDISGDSEYAIDLSDLIEFCKDEPQVWLWEACWRVDYWDVWGIIDGGGEEMMSSSMAMAESVYSAQTLQTELVQPIYEPTPAEVAENITDILDFLDTVLEKDDPENKEGILEMKAVLEGWLDEIEL
jgi:hypothetical protein